MPDGKTPKIADNPSIRKAKLQVGTLLAVKKMYSVLRVPMRILGINVEKCDSWFENADLEKMWETLETPDKFNETFGDRGWIIYGNMNVEMAKQALEIVENDGMESAEDFLVSYYDSHEIKRQIDALRSLDSFEPRSDLAYKAWQDYNEGRYHACVPVVLSLIDGTVIQCSIDNFEYKQGFFWKTVDFHAWDSVAAHENGLERLTEPDLFLKNRGTTVEEDIEMPYRHGIHHGLDLGYDNEIVAAKSWSLLFAVGEWIKLVENGEIEEPEFENKSILDILKDSFEEVKASTEQYTDTQENKEEIREWEARDIEVEEDIPSKGNPEEYREGTPERQLAEFLSNWEGGKWGLLLGCFIDRRGDYENVHRIKEDFSNISEWRFINIQDSASAQTEFVVDL